MSTDPSDLGPISSREDVERVLSTLAGRIDDLEASRKQQNLERAQDRKRITALEEENDELDSRVQELEAMHAALRDVSSGKTTKEEKIATVVGYAENKHSLEDKPMVSVVPKRIAELTGCSRRYAYDLVDDMVRDYDWALDPREEPQYGSLEKETTRKGVLVNFELLHEDAESVNLFTTGGE